MDPFYVIIIISVIIVTSFMVILHLSKPQCKGCGSRSLDYLHLRTDGMPDLRYRHNPIVCYKCGHTKSSLEYKVINELREHRATKKYQKSADDGDASAQYHLGKLYSAGYEVDKDYEKAQEWYQKAVSQGHPEARKALGELQYSLGNIYFYGNEVSQDIPTAKKYFKLSCENGNKDSCEMLKDLDELGH